MAQPDTSDPTDDLHGNVAGGEGSGMFALQRERERHNRVEMRPRNWAKHRDDHIESAPSGNDVGAAVFPAAR